MDEMTVSRVAQRREKCPVYAFTLNELRPFPIEYFNEGEISAAQKWLSEE